MIRGKKLKLIAIYLLLNFVFQLVAPSVSYALTGGPSQPEVNSFEPVGTTQMVDLYSGDFNYNIPLLNVPGSNGSYPINIAYHGGIGMEQEASFVGLGWNINPGAIVRQMRGLPDDFNGDEVVKEFSIKKDFTIGIRGGLSAEVLGANTPSLGMNVYYNSYRGVGYGVSANLSNVFSKTLKVKDGQSPINLGLNFDSQGGMSVQPSIGLGNTSSTKQNNLTIGASLNSIQGLQETSFTYNKQEKNKKEEDKNNGTMSSGNGAGFSLSLSGYIPGIQTSMWSTSFNGGASFGPKGPGVYGKYNAGFSYTETHVQNKERTVKAYGFLNAEGADGDDDAIMDFNREKDGPISKESPYTPLPVRTNDIYSIQGQGIGGAFRAFRSDIGHLKDVVTKSTGVSARIQVESGIGAGAEFGLDGSVGYSRSYSGPWKERNHSISQLDRYKSKGYNSLKPEYEKFYFKPNGELTASSLNEIDRVGGDEPIAFDLAMHWEGVGVKPKVKNTIKDGNYANFNDRSEREKRSQHIEYFTAGELNKNTGYIKPHHIYEMAVRNPDGNKYVYGLPAYNTTQKEVSFSVNPSYGSITNAYSNNEKSVPYAAGVDNSKNNNKGDDNFFSSTTLPAFAHSYMLTSIQSHDYVDLTGNGVSEDDFGFWANFKYQSVSGYKWRFPYEEDTANYSKGHYSNLGDDKASYVYGEKTLQYLDTIETNTHYAVFEKGDRADGVGVQGENGGRGSVKQKYLKSISLYSKNDSTPIKVIHFEYDYSLCQGIPSNDGTTDGYITSNQGGKLTLKKIYFTYLDSKKGALTPYVFNYGPDNNVHNPDYSVSSVDRWGNYQPTQGGFTNYIENPYTRQEVTEANNNIQAWSLKEIDLPSGSTIKVTYESDDYQYVQNKKAMQMLEIVGSSGDTDSIPTSTGSSITLSKENRRLYFKTYESLETNQDVYSYINNIQDLYFKVFMNIKTNAGVTYKDYISGYVPILKTTGSYGMVNDSTGYLTLDYVDHKGKKGGNYQVNPIQLAGWRHMRYERPDLARKYSRGLGPIYGNIVKIIEEASTLIAGYYNKCKVLNYCGSISNSTSHKSYLRLNTNKKKLGGGQRVKKIEIYSDWEGETEVYGQEYNYQLKDGSSSGVAEYEPMTGGDEISLRLPKYFDQKKSLLMKHQDFKEEPYGESFFPGAKVGYSRVEVRNLRHVNVSKAQTGISVNEFYTSKDFPVIVKKALETVKSKGYNLPIFIPLVGSQSFQNNGYSNGYSIILNDMPGKPKSVSTYPYDSDLNSNPVSSTVYNYQTKTTSNYNGDEVLELDNKVKVLDAHGQSRYAKIGESYDFYIDQAEHSSFSLSAGLQTNLNVEFFWLAIPSVFPSLEYNQSLYRHVITNKVIYRNGVLKSVKNTTDGASVIATNELYDAETGQVLLTSSDNEHEQPIYNYSYAAHWAYDGMGGAYKNYRATFDINYLSGSTYKFGNTSFNVEDYLSLGDKVVNVENNTQYGWITSIDSTNNQFEITDEYSTNPFTTTTNVTIIESGRKNMHSISNGNIVSFEDPSFMHNYSPSKLQVFREINKALDAGKTNNFDINLCGGIYKVNINTTYLKGYYNGPTYYGFYNWLQFFITFTYVSGATTLSSTESVVNIYADDYFSHPESIYLDTNFNHYRYDLNSHNETLNMLNFTYIGSLTANFNQPVTTAELTYECEDETFPILQASATEFCDTCWVYDYTDVGSPVVDGGDTLAHNSSLFNPYAYGQKGVWRPLRSHAYQAPRKQSGSKGDNTRIDIDGQFDFVPFNWEESILGNKNWTWTSEVTKYSPYGFQLENRNPLNIYSSEMYGYNNTVVTAVASNAKYNEIAFDGFEAGNTLPYGPLRTHEKQGHMFNCTTIKGISHTGDFSMTLENTETYTPSITLIPGKKYTISAWTSRKSLLGEIGFGYIKVYDGPTLIGTATVDGTFKEIDGWIKIETDFIPTGTSITLEFNNIGASDESIFDDIRISPFNGAMKTYVYDPATLWLVAELDNLNYATFYNYDLQGNLVQVKKETDRGIVTVKSTRNNTAH